MELGKIKARIREKGFNPMIPLVLPGTNKIAWVGVQKNALMVELDKVFPTKVSETGLIFDGEKLMPTKMASSQQVPNEETVTTPQDSHTSHVERALADEDDLLADEDDLLADPPADDDDEDLLA